MRQEQHVIVSSFKNGHDTASARWLGGGHREQLLRSPIEIVGIEAHVSERVRNNMGVKPG